MVGACYFAGSFPDLWLQALDTTYPIFPSILQMLPKDSTIMHNVLRDTSAAQAIMYLGDAELAHRSMAGSSIPARELHVKVLCGGIEKSAGTLSPADAEKWLKLRKVQLQKKTNATTLLRKIIHRLVNPNTEEIENAKRRLQNIVNRYSVEES